MRESTITCPPRSGLHRRARTPRRISPPHYPAHMEVRRVSHCGTFRLHSAQPFLSNALRDEHIGLEEVDDGVWNIVYYRTLLGRIDERTLLITGV